MSAPAQSALAATLSFIFKGRPSPSKIRVLSYRDEMTFSDLWLKGLNTELTEVQIAGEPVDWNNANTTFLIVGNDTPERIFANQSASLGNINFGDHFTASSWLAAWKLRNPALKARIAIVDPNPPELSGPTAHALQTILGAKDSIGRTLVPRAAVLPAPTLESICQWIHDTKKDDRDTSESIRDLLKSTTWNALTSEREQHHAISNILGPLILSGKPEANPPVLHNETLLRRLLSACDLVSWEEAPAPSGGEIEGQKSEDNIAVERGEGLNILLLDDQAKEGWEDWVTGCLPDATIKAHTDPDKLLTAINNALSQDKKDARFQLNLPDLEDPTFPILLLDLRLFSGKVADELKFYKEKLLPLIETRFMERDGLAWPGFKSKDNVRTETVFAKARMVIKKDKLSFIVDSPQHHEALTWLPRVVALADMSIPIILFSSTGRRDLAEPFKPYGNIITTFAKPRLSDLARGKSDPAPDIRTSTAASLRGAVAEARRWLKVREAVGRVVNTDLQPLGEARRAFSAKNHFEIYHDESGDVEQDVFRVASLLVGFDDSTAANRNNQNFAIMFCWGSNARDENCADKRALAARGHRKQIIEAEANRWRNTLRPGLDLERTPMLLAVAARGKEVSATGPSNSIFDPGGLDNINWDLLMLQWEGLLVDVLPALVKGRTEEKALSIGIYGATRFRAVKLTAKEPQLALDEAHGVLEKMRKHWGIDLRNDGESRYVKDARDFPVSARKDGRLTLHDHPGTELPFKLLWRSLEADSFWKLAADALLGRKESEHYPKVSQAIQSAIGITLAYGPELMDPRGRKLHHLADVLAGLADISAGKQTIAVRAPPFDESKHKASVAFRSRILSILNANRLLDVGNCDSEALGVFDWLSHAEDKKDIAYLALAERLKERLPQLQGSDVVRLVGLLENPAEWMDRNRIHTADRAGVKVSGTSWKKHGAA